MRSTTLKIQINPVLLKWARESAGVSLEQVAKRVRTSVDVVIQWESGERQPTLRILEELATFYKRPLAAFFLPEPPPEPPLPTDFRTLPNIPPLPLSRPTRLAIREARRLQRVAKDLMTEMTLSIQVPFSKTTLDADPEELATVERKRLGVEIEEQLSWRDRHVAFREWRQALEKLNILVFQAQMPLEEARGFSLSEDGLPAIVLNASDSVYARIFTLFHEYAHLLLDTAGICLPQEDPMVGTQRIEKFCNHFAGAFLVPKNILQSLLPARTLSDEDLKQMSARFKVSQQVIWRRVQMLGLISRAQYQAKLHTWEEEYRKPPQRASSFAVSPAQRCLREKGPRFTSLVLEAKDRGIITYNDVADYLSIKTGYLDKVQSLLAGQVHAR